jgi:rSAM/selenodomain-associated transferase 1
MSTHIQAHSPRILGLFAKRPRAGQVKTRLAAEVSSEWAEEAATAFLLDVVDKYATVGDNRVLVYTPSQEREFFARIAGANYQIVPQIEGDLGCRMHDFVLAQMQTRKERIVVLGTDSPTLPVSYVEQAFAHLETSDVVLGPAFDGGYYLLGCARRLPPIFERIAWGGPNVLAETIEKLHDPNWSVALLPMWYDVDTLEDWRFIRSHIAAMRRAGIDPQAPRTEQLTLAQPR